MLFITGFGQAVAQSSSPTLVYVKNDTGKDLSIVYGTKGGGWSQGATVYGEPSMNQIIVLKDARVADGLYTFVFYYNRSNVSLVIDKSCKGISNFQIRAPMNTVLTLSKFTYSAGKGYGATIACGNRRP